MPKTPPNLPRLLPSGDPTDRVQVQQTAFTDDVIGRYICNDWSEVEAQLADGGFGFDAVIIGAGMFGGYLAEKLYRHSAALGLRILILDAGAYLLPSHVQDLPHRLGGSIGGPDYMRAREDGSGAQNVVWGVPWISNEPFTGLAYCIGGRSLFWGGWSPRLTAADLARWPAQLGAYLTQPGAGGSSPYADTEAEIGTATTADYMLKTQFHNVLLAKLTDTAASRPELTQVAEAPLAVQGSAPDTGLFAFDKFSAMPFLMDAVRDDVATNTGEGDLSRRLFLVPRTHVLSLNTADGKVSGVQLVSNGTRAYLSIAASCAVVLANGTIEASRLALTSLGVGDRTFGSPRLGNLMAHLRSNITVRIARTALGLPAGPPADLETTAFLIRGSAGGRQFHFQVSAAAVGGQDPEKNMWQQVPDIDTLAQIRANQDPRWITLVFRGIGEMEDSHAAPADPARSWIDLSAETDEYGMPRAYVQLAPTAVVDAATWDAMDEAAFSFAAALAGDPTNIQYLERRTGNWLPQRPPADASGGGSWRDPLGSTHHEAGTLFMGRPGASVTDLDGRFHGCANAYVAGPALFPSLGSANPSLTALSLARRTAGAICTAQTLLPPAGGTRLAFDPANWTMVAAPGTNPSVRRVGSLLQTAAGYGLYWYTAEQFSNFRLWLEWRTEHAGDNSGVYIRIPDPSTPDALHQADITGHEIQIDDVGAGNPVGQAIHRTGAIYGLQAPSGFPGNGPGRWNSMLIEANGPHITVTINGQLVNDFISDRAGKGFIALQAHDWPSRVQYRNLQITALP